jgi:exopolyphosphatase/guanosine-5'-triphosphate,3'-diphosphate pyrophosphatase
MLLEHRIVPVPPQDLVSDDDLHDELWTVIEALDASGVYLVNTEHMGDRDLYARLYYRILDEPTRCLPPDSEAAEYIDCLHPMDLNPGSMGSRMFERMEKRGLKPDRADTIVPAGIVYLHLGELAGVTDLLVPRVGIKDGLLTEVVQGHFETFAAEDHVDVVLSSCRAMCRRFHAEREHAETVLTLARQLFDQTKELHGLGGRARVLLEAAALLHDVGVAVNNDGHHKHSQYLIASSDLVGLSDEERRIVAMLARYHRKAPPQREHEDFMQLRRKDRTLVERLTAILRLADALDRQHAAVVRGVSVKIREDRVELRPILAGGDRTRLTLEARAVEEKGAWFTELFGRRPELLAP